MNRLARTFKKLRLSRQKALIAFLTAGYPDLPTTERLVRAFCDNGVDVIELGVPFSDPIADGSVIQEASQRALERGVSLRSVLALVRRLRRLTPVPLCIMSYYNPIFVFGVERFLAEAAAAGLDGLIVPDLPLEEAAELKRLSAASGIATVLFVTPTTSPLRMRRIVRLSSGFVYYVSLTGVTGTRGVMARDIAAHIRKIKKETDKPVCVGFGISTPGQVKAVSRIADGVIVGSAIIKEIRRNAGSKDLVARVSRFVKKLSLARAP